MGTMTPTGVEQRGISAQPLTWEATLKREGEPERKVLIVRQGGDRSVVPFEVVVHACKSAEKLLDFAKQFEDLIDRLGQWLIDHSAEVDRAYLAPKPEGLLFAVIRREKTFSPAFEDRLSDLDLEIARDRDFDLVHLRMIALPNCSDEAVASFVDLSHALVNRLN